MALSTIRLSRFALATALALAALAAVAGAQAPPAVPASESSSPSLAEIDARLQEIQGSSSLDESTKAAIVALYGQARENVAKGAEIREQTAEFERLAAEAPAALMAIRDELSKPPAEPRIEVAPGTTLDQIRERAAQAEADLSAARDNVEELRGEAEARAARRAALADEQAAARGDLDQLREQARAAPPPASEIDVARATLLRSRIDAADVRVALLGAEQRAHEARAELLPARRDRAGRRVTDAERAAAAWRDVVSRESQRVLSEEAESASRLAREVEASHPELVELSTENEALAAARKTAQEKLAAVSAELALAQALRDRVRADFRSSRRKLEAAGLSHAMGLHLRTEYQRLPGIARSKERLRELAGDLSDLQYELIVLEEERTTSGDVEGQLSLLLDTLGPAGDRAEADARKEVARTLLARHRDLLDGLLADQDRHFDRLVELDLTLRDLVAEGSRYRRYIEENILWVRSAKPASILDLRAIAGAAAWLLSPTQWVEALRNSRAWVGERWQTAVACLLLLLVVAAARPAFKSALGEIAVRVSRVDTDTIWQTVRGLIFAVLLAAPVPLLFEGIGVALDGPPGQNALGVAVGDGLRALALTIFPFELLRQILHQSGIGPKHFGWPATRLSPVRRAMLRIMVVYGCCIFLSRTLAAQPNESWNSSLGRVAFVAGTVAVVYFVRRIFRRSGPLFGDAAPGQLGLLHRARPMWYPAALVVPSLLGVLAIAGYYYTALELRESLRATMLLVIGLLIGNAILLRWLFLARRRLVVEERRKRVEAEAALETAREAAREAVEAAKEAAHDAEPDGVGAPQAPPVPLQLQAPVPAAKEAAAAGIAEAIADVPEIDARTRRLFRSIVIATLLIGLFAIWRDALPALRMLERVQLWPTVAITDPASRAERAVEAPVVPASSASSDAATTTPAPGGATSTGGALALRAAPQAANSTAAPPITLADLLVAVLMAVVTVIAVRNVPALLEIAIVSRLPIDSGARYALLTVFKYLIMLTGVVVTFGVVGIGWSNVQWIAAALTFGLAFGLQEIFANFISGLIILGERPIRVGDTVTVQGITGTVSRIRMRATTIIDWDLKEMIIPNKSFITEEVVNWTLTSPSLRVVIPVGVAYAADVDEVEAILRSVARDHASVLADPGPVVVFTSFGDSTLNFELRVYIPSIDHMLSVRDELNRAILSRFRAAGVEIAFPQRDINIRSAVPVEIVTTGDIRREEPT